MRLPILQVIVLFIVVTGVAAFIFRSERAKGMVHFLMKLAYAYIIAIVVLAVLRVGQMVL